MLYLRVILFLSILICSCDSTNQYDVYVVNNTGSELEVSFKSLVDQRGVHEDVIRLSNQDRIKIVSTKNIKKDDPLAGPSSNQCGQVLEYLKASINDTLVNNEKWCSEDIEMIHVDVGQGEFVVEYQRADFN